MGTDVAAGQLPLDPADVVAPPVMVHAGICVRRKAGRSFTLEDVSSAQGHVIVQFDGGSFSR